MKEGRNKPAVSELMALADGLMQRHRRPVVFELMVLGDELMQIDSGVLVNKSLINQIKTIEPNDYISTITRQKRDIPVTHNRFINQRHTSGRRRY